MSIVLITCRRKVNGFGLEGEIRQKKVERQKVNLVQLKINVFFGHLALCCLYLSIQQCMIN